MFTIPTWPFLVAHEGIVRPDLMELSGSTSFGPSSRLTTPHGPSQPFAKANKSGARPDPNELSGLMYFRPNSSFAILYR